MIFIGGLNVYNKSNLCAEIYFRKNQYENDSTFLRDSYEVHGESYADYIDEPYEDYFDQQEN